MATPAPSLQPGLRGVVSITVSPADTAIALGSGDVAVLGTPRAVALVEAATVAAVAGVLDANNTTVGTRVELEHLVPSAVGRQVTAEAVLAAVDGRRLTFEVIVHDGDQAVAHGSVHRIVVDRNRFLGGAGVIE